MPEETKVMIVTACRCYLGQTVIEVPCFATEDRIKGLIRNGGALATYLARNIKFGRIEGTGLANPTVRDWKAGFSSQHQVPPPAEHTLADIGSALRADGFIF